MFIISCPIQSHLGLSSSAESLQLFLFVPKTHKASVVVCLKMMHVLIHRVASMLIYFPLRTWENPPKSCQYFVLVGTTTTTTTTKKALYKAIKPSAVKCYQNYAILSFGSIHPELSPAIKAFSLGSYTWLLSPLLYKWRPGLQSSLTIVSYLDGQILSQSDLCFIPFITLDNN